jgi:hypothetical protein
MPVLAYSAFASRNVLQIVESQDFDRGGPCGRTAEESLAQGVWPL